MKSIMRRPSEKRPVGWWKNVFPYGGNAEAGRLFGSERPSKFPVSAIESPKLMIDLIFRHCVCEFTLVTKKVDKMKLTSFMNRRESGDAMHARGPKVALLLFSIRSETKYNKLLGR